MKRGASALGTAPYVRRTYAISGLVAAQAWLVFTCAGRTQCVYLSASAAPL